MCPQTLSQLRFYCKDKLGRFLDVFLYSFTFILVHFSKESPHCISIPSLPSFLTFPHLPLFPGIPSPSGSLPDYLHVEVAPPTTSFTFIAKHLKPEGWWGG